MERLLVKDLQQTLENVIYELMGTKNMNLRWVDGYFPFTKPSLEMEIFINNDWVEILGCGNLFLKTL